MSGDQFVARAGAIGLSATTTLCLLAVKASASRPLNIEAIRVSSNGAVAGSVYFWAQRINNSPATTGTATITNQDPTHTPALFTAFAPSNVNPGAWTTAPTTTGGALWEEWVPIGGGWAEWLPDGKQIDTDTSTNAWIGIFANASVAVANTVAPNGAYAAFVVSE